MVVQSFGRCCLLRISAFGRSIHNTSEILWGTWELLTSSHTFPCNAWCASIRYPSLLDNALLFLRGESLGALVAVWLILESSCLLFPTVWMYVIPTYTFPFFWQIFVIVSILLFYLIWSVNIMLGFVCWEVNWRYGVNIKGRRLLSPGGAESELWLV